MKKKLYIFFISLLCFIYFTFSYISYYKMLSTFKESFNKKDYVAASSTIMNKCNNNIFKTIFLENNLNTYFNSTIDKLEADINNNSIDHNVAIDFFYELNRYNFSSNRIDNLLNKLNYSNPFEEGLSYYNSNDYETAYKYFATVSPNDYNYSASYKYLTLCRNLIKNNTLQTASNLCLDNYYTKALELINDIEDIFPYDTDIMNKKSAILSARTEYLNQQVSSSEVTTSSSLPIDNISTSNINRLSLSSTTNYLIYVDLSEQKTYIYKGSMNNWHILKEFSCSSGLSGSDTPTGVYTIAERGDWFFSSKYQQGAKYWVQFSGNYLFHSLPYNEDKSQILDYTLGKPSSHGCIRLSVSDSKWLYDNIPEHTKVIIK